MDIDRCQVGGRFSRCHEPAIDTCQYCARPFCAGHAYYREGHEAVCTGKHCRKKRDDLVVHHGYRERVTERNRVGLCGEEGCGPHPHFQCSLCRGLFCDLHIGERMYPFRQGGAITEQRLATCGRCWSRRAVWRR